MEVILVKFLAPFLPYLLGVADSGAKAASEAFGEKAWTSALRLWRSTTPHFGARPLATAAALAHSPENDDFGAALADDLKCVLDGDPQLRSTVTRMFRDLNIKEQAVSVEARRSAIVQGSGNPTNLGGGDILATSGNYSPAVKGSPGTRINSPTNIRHLQGDNPWRDADGAALVFLVLGSLTAILGFAVFAYSIFQASQSHSSAAGGFPTSTGVGFTIFIAGGVVGGIGAVLNRNNF